MAQFHRSSVFVRFCINSVSVLYRFRDITTFIAYVTACVWSLEVLHFRYGHYRLRIPVLWYTFNSCMNKHLAITRCLFRGVKFQIVKNNSNNFQGHSRPLILTQFDRLRMISYSHLFAFPVVTMKLCHYMASFQI